MAFRKAIPMKAFNPSRLTELPVDPNMCTVINESLLGYKASLATSTDKAALASIHVSSYNDAEAFTTNVVDLLYSISQIHNF
ncbi:hypothetical protein DPMN_168682 [Dreissena polymorpha]|uniref:Uncharacterized protein n=1 Tax=Dreissena polymorpha TaxID=45954 RepID=A0A9D4F148_DREPO|nr:hypothetical protein DPMN_168682 [Dreissena polymorpha]